MSILDKNLTEFYITKQYWDFGGGKIYDENQNLIGTISNKLFSINKRFEIGDKDNTLLAYIEKKTFNFRKIQVIKDLNSKNVFKLVRKKILFKPPKFYLKSKSGKYQFHALGKDPHNNYNIFNTINGKIVGKVSKSNKDLISLKIFELEEERLPIIMMVLSIENILNATFLFSDIAGYGRLTMRLRPFGPGIKEKNLK